jgi:microcystin-dependent protein
MSYLEKAWIDENWMSKSNYEEVVTAGLPNDKPAVNFLVRFSSTDKCVYVFQGDGTGLNGVWSKGLGGSGSGLTPFFKNNSFSAKIGELYLTDVSTQSIAVDMSNTLKKDDTTGLYSINLKSGDYFEIFIVNGDTSKNTVTVSLSTLQNTPYNITEKLEGQSGSDFIFNSNSYFRFTYVNDSIGWKVSSMSGATPNEGITGSVIQFSGFVSPSGYFFANGASTSRTDYANLFNVLTFRTNGALSNGTKNVTVASTSNLYLNERIEGTGIPDGTTITSITDATHFVISNNATITGTTSILVLPYGSVSNTTFNLPNFCGRVPVMPDGTTEFKALGITGGEKSHQLTQAEMPSHQHYIYGSKGVDDKNFDGTGGRVSASDTQNSWNPVTGSAGNDYAHNNIQPYIGINMIIKY